MVSGQQFCAFLASSFHFGLCGPAIGVVVDSVACTVFFFGASAIVLLRLHILHKMLSLAQLALTLEKRRLLVATHAIEQFDADENTFNHFVAKC